MTEVQSLWDITQSDPVRDYAVATAFGPETDEVFQRNCPLVFIKLVALVLHPRGQLQADLTREVLPKFHMVRSDISYITPSNSRPVYPRLWAAFEPCPPSETLLDQLNFRVFEAGLDVVTYTGQRRDIYVMQAGCIQSNQLGDLYDGDNEQLNVFEMILDKIKATDKA